MEDVEGRLAQINRSVMVLSDLVGPQILQLKNVTFWTQLIMIILLSLILWRVW